MNKSEQSTDINLTGVGSFRIFYAQAPNNGRERQLLSTYMDTLNCLVVEIRMLRGFTTLSPLNVDSVPAPKYPGPGTSSGTRDPGLSPGPADIPKSTLVHTYPNSLYVCHVEVLSTF